MYWESIWMQMLQNRNDPELAPFALCMRCGNEVYSAEAYEEHNGLCQDCWEEETDEADTTT